MPAHDGFQLQDRDIELLHFVQQLRIATIDHLAALSGRSVRALWGRLHKLRERRYLASVARFMQKQVYAVGSVGVRVMIEQGYAPANLKEKRIRHNELTEIGIRHSLFVADIHARILLSTRTGPIKLADWQEGSVLWDSVISDGLALAPAEAVEPWIFDPDIAQALGRGEITLDEKTVDLVARPARSASGSKEFSLRAGNLVIRKKLTGLETGVLQGRRYKMRIRNRDSNVALLELRGWAPKSLVAVEQRVEAESAWRGAMLFRLSGPQPNMLFTEARVVDGRLQLKHPVDDTSYGSPIYLEEGALGILQDSNSGALIKGELRNLQ